MLWDSRAFLLTFCLHDVSGKGEHELNLTGPLLLLLSELCHAIMLTFQDPDMIFRISSSLFTPFNVADLGIIPYYTIPTKIFSIHGISDSSTSMAPGF